MKKSIPVSELKVGMTVTGVDKNWFQTTLVSHHFTIRSSDDIEKLKKNGIRTVSVDLAEQESPSSPPPSRETVPTDRSPETQTPSAASPSEGTQEVPEPTSKDLSEIQRIQSETATILESAFQDVRLGHAIDTRKIREMVRKTIDLILANKDSVSFLSDISGSDDETFVHSANTMLLSVGYSIRKDYPEEEWMAWGMAASLHDLGKIFIPADILKKPGRLTTEEWEQMRKHPLLGYQFLKKSTEPDIRNLAAKVAVEHHERHGGKGYPYGLDLPEIHPVSQGIMVLDVYEALTADRVYRKGMPPHKAMSFLMDNTMGLDREIGRTLANMVGIYPAGTLLGLPDGNIGILMAYQDESVLTGLAKILVLFSPDMKPLPTPYTKEMAIGTKERFFPTYTPKQLGLTSQQIIKAIKQFAR